ncbi:hypothetical protein AMTR_s00114p00107480 [Amborella trichopoda]|uniref:Uncharacterized protein n=1 Tax=Amborella trichopoda TaxID=13333 RepID=W1NUC2_AMBTC|nr:hypothetical protein AMTR_s00114p00107480 [Amborella trichopoda]
MMLTSYLIPLFSMTILRSCKFPRSCISQSPKGRRIMITSPLQLLTSKVALNSCKSLVSCISQSPKGRRIVLTSQTKPTTCMTLKRSCASQPMLWRLRLLIKTLHVVLLSPPMTSSTCPNIPAHQIMKKMDYEPTQNQRLNEGNGMSTPFAVIDTTTSQDTQKQGLGYLGNAGLSPWPFFTVNLSRDGISRTVTVSP